MSVSVTYNSGCTVVETIANNNDSIASSNAGVTHSAFNTADTLNAGTTPPATKVACFVLPLATNTATIDLTALTGTNGAIVDGTNLKVQVFKMKNLAASANLMTLSVGAADGYDLMGAAMSVTLEPGQEFLFYGNDDTPDIIDADSELDILGTDEQECEITIVMG